MLNVKVGDLVQLHGFTGIKLAMLPVSKVSKEEITLIKKNGDEMVFNIKTGKQTNAGNPKYANSITADEKKPTGKKPTKKPVEIDEDDEELEKSPPVKKAKKAPAKKKPVEVEEEDDFEDLDDEEFDEI